jgi:hypothetical protein
MIFNKLLVKMRALFDLRTIAVFKASIPPERWDAIRVIEVYAMVYRKDDIVDAVEARSRLQLEAWPTACTALGSTPNLRTLGIVVGNASYLDEGYLAGGRMMGQGEVVERFLGDCKVSAKVEVALA